MSGNNSNKTEERYETTRVTHLGSVFGADGLQTGWGNHSGSDGALDQRSCREVSGSSAGLGVSSF
jgi:hypothetical protein